MKEPGDDHCAKRYRLCDSVTTVAQDPSAGQNGCCLGNLRLVFAQLAFTVLGKLLAGGDLEAQRCERWFIRKVGRHSSYSMLRPSAQTRRAREVVLLNGLLRGFEVEAAAISVIAD